MAVGTVGAGVRSGRKRAATVAYTAHAVWLPREVTVCPSFVLSGVVHRSIVAIDE